MSKKKALIRKVYAEVPKVECKGLCVDQCTIIGFTTTERAMMKTASGKEPNITDEGDCNYLTNGRCSIYANRPLICRLFGAVTDLRCEHGCKPKKFLTPEQSNRLMATVDVIGGGLVCANVESVEQVDAAMQKRATRYNEQELVERNKKFLKYVDDLKFFKYVNDLCNAKNADTR